LAALFLALAVSNVPAASSSELELSQAVREALESNLDLAARARALEANREEIGIARASLLPQIDFGTKATYLDQDRSHDDRGNLTQESVTVGAKLEQVLYDENAWAGFRIQQRVFEEQQAEFEGFRLGIVQEAANAFLELDHAQALLGVQERNRALTARNIETSRARIAAGYSSKREVLRWESQLATNDRSVVGARAEVMVVGFELNRVRNRPAEEPVAPLPASLAEYGFVYSRERIAQAIANPEADRRLRDTFVRVGISRSPDLAAIDASIQAAERLRTASQRAFWVPSLSFAAGIDHLAASGTAPDFNATEWGVGVGLAFPLLRGGSRFAQLEQSREGLASLGIERRSAAQRVEQAVRAAFASASASWANLALARTQESIARRNFELVDHSYRLGVASILALLDAQSQLLMAEQAVTDAHYGLLEDVITAERSISLYPFLEPDADTEALLDELERKLAPPP
jgi:multidrug efflux system outer membrane protein